MPRLNGFINTGYFARSNNINSSRCVNLYPEVDPDPAAKGKMCLVGTPGTSAPFCTLPTTPHRGVYAFNGFMYAVGGGVLYQIDAIGNINTIGNLNTNSGPVQFKDNGLLSSGVGGNQLGFVDGQNGYVYDVSTNSLSTISTSGGFPKFPTALEFLDGYMVSISTDMGYSVSDLYDITTWNALATAYIPATSDPIKSVINYRQQLLFIKSLSTEIWYDAGVSTSDGSPFSRVPGSVLDFGTYAPQSVSQANGAVYLLGWQRNKDYAQFVGILQYTGGMPVVVSPPGINYRISQFQTVSDAFAIVYSQSGHTFYQLTFPSANWTVVADLSSSPIWWHERSTYIETLPWGGRHLADVYCLFNGRHYVGDYRNGNIYEWREDVFSDNGEPLLRVRQSPIIFDPNDSDIFSVHKFRVDAEMGRGNPAHTDPPVAMLSWSNDGGETWGNEVSASMGFSGNYRSQQLSWGPLGIARNKVFRLVMSAPYRPILAGAYVE